MVIINLMLIAAQRLASEANVHVNEALKALHALDLGTPSQKLIEWLKQNGHKK